MLKGTFTILTVIATIVVAHGQKSTYFGLEIGPKFEVYSYTDEHNYLYTQPFYSAPVYGVYVGRYLNEILTAETGLYFVEYGESYRRIGSLYYVITNGIFVYQIPFRLKARIKLIEDRLNVATVIGYSLNINSNYDSFGWGWGSYFDGQDSLFTSDSSYYDLRKTYPLLETGLALEYHLRNRMVIYFAWRYFIGFTRVINIDVYHRINNEPNKYANVFSKGDYYSFVLGVQFPIGKREVK